MSWPIRRLRDTWVSGAALPIAVDEFVDGQAEIELFLTADTNFAIASLLLNLVGRAALVADPLGLAPDVQHAVGIPDLMITQVLALRAIVVP